MPLQPFLFGVLVLCLFAQGCQTPQIPPAEQPRPVEKVRNKGVMENKFAALRKDMTKAEVNAILGPTTGCTLGGGSFSTCEQYCYSWRGDDGLIFITFAKNGKAEYTHWGPPGMQDKISTMYWQPEAAQN